MIDAKIIVLIILSLSLIGMASMIIDMLRVDESSKTIVKKPRKSVDN